MQKLNRNTVEGLSPLPIKIMQFGGGNFLRAFVDWMVQVLNKETNFNAGIAVVKPTESGDYSALKSQDGLFTVVLDGIKNGELIAEKTIVDCVQKVLHTYNEWDAYIALAENSDVRFVISNTTEAGIKFNSNDQFEVNPPQEFPAKLTRWLYHRFQYFKGDSSKGCILLPCELIENNGVELKRVVLQYADHWGLNNDFKTWINTSNYFCSTLVDRIVSGFPKERVDEILAETKYEDELLVAGEYYHSWVIAGDSIIQDELPFAQTDLNVEFVEDLGPYREMKVRILNGAHTSLVPVGYLSGIRFVKEAMDDSVVSNFVESLLNEESAKTLDFPNEVKQKFIAAVLDRFRNPLLKHQLISISLNSTSKFVSRLLPTLKDYSAIERKLPKRIVFGLSALIRFYKGDFDGEEIDLKDDPVVLDFFSDIYSKLDAGVISLVTAVDIILSNSNIWGEDLTLIDGLAKSVLNNIDNIESKGIKTSIQLL
ncbi:tagaturonate reductase [Kriegella sp. EG-1]|nr:tagaturonate reductase [Flavobacteriaceae bacterium EG-1]